MVRSSYFLLLIMLMIGMGSYAQSPYKVNGVADAPLFFGGGLGWVLSQKLTTEYPPMTQAQILSLQRSDVPAFDRGATHQWSPSAGNLSNFTAMGCMVTPLAYTLIDSRARKDWLKIGLMGYEVFALNQLATNFTKWAVHRPRPFAYNEDAPMSERLTGDARLSFFSGHTSTSAAMCFMTAKLFSDYHPDSKFRPYVWAAAAALPLVTGFLRYRAGKHFPTDILVGYVVGGAIGILIPEIHRHF